MKKLLFIALLCASTATMAYAENSGAAPGNPPAQSAGNDGQPGEKFEAVKAKILAHLREKEACVQAAATREALKACMPRMGEHKGKWGKGEGNNGVGGGFGGGQTQNRGNGNNEPAAQ